MADERIDIKIQDSIAASIKTKLLGIATASKSANTQVEKLKAALKDIDLSGSAKLTSALASLTSAQARLQSATAKTTASQDKAAIAQAKLATEVQRTATAEYKAAAAQSSATAAAARAKTATASLQQQQAKLNTTVSKGTTAYSGFTSAVKSYIAVGLGSAVALTAADSYTVLQNKLKNVVDTEDQLAEVTERVFEVANNTRTPVDETAQAFQRFDLALSQLGASQEESLELTETINKALTSSGATTSEQAAALLQLSQAFNKGKLDGDEFRSVMELMPSAADAIAEELGVVRGELLNMAPEGKITTEVMRSAFANAADEIDAKFSKTTVTVGQSFTILKNNAVQFLGEIDKGAGITAGFSSAILALANNMDILGVAAVAVGSAVAVAFGSSILSSIRTATSAMTTFTAAIAANPIGLIVVAVATATAALYTFGDQISVTSDGVVSLLDVLRSSFNLIVEYLTPVANFFLDIWDAAFSDAGTAADSFTDYMGNAIGTIVDTAKTIVNTYVGLWVGAYDTIVNGWELFPGALKDIVMSAFNGVISIVETGVNAVLSGLSSILELANEASEFLGGSAIFGTDFDVDLSGFKGELSGAASELGDVSGTAFAAALTKDYVGNIKTAVMTGAREIAEKRTATEVQTPQLRQASDPTANTKAVKDLNSETEKTIELTEAEILLRDTLQSYYDENQGALEELEVKLVAANAALEAGFITTEQFNSEIAEMNGQIADLNIQMGSTEWADYWDSALLGIKDNFTSVTQSMSESFDSFTSSITSGFSSSLADMIVNGEDFASSFQSVLNSAITSAIASIIEMGIQWVATEALKTSATTSTTAGIATQTAASVTAAATATTAGEAALATATASGVVAAATLASSWSTAAIAASIASYGTASSTGLAAYTSALATAKAATVAGFESGGYTGNGGTSEVAGVVHGQEYVMNAAAVSRIGVSTLDACKVGLRVFNRGQRWPLTRKALLVPMGPGMVPARQRKAHLLI